MSAAFLVISVAVLLAAWRVWRWSETASLEQLAQSGRWASRVAILAAAVSVALLIWPLLRKAQPSDSENSDTKLSPLRPPRQPQPMQPKANGETGAFVPKVVFDDAALAERNFRNEFAGLLRFCVPTASPSPKYAGWFWEDESWSLQAIPHPCNSKKPSAIRPVQVRELLP